MQVPQLWCACLPHDFDLLRNNCVAKIAADAKHREGDKQRAQKKAAKKHADKAAKKAVEKATQSVSISVNFAHCSN